ncbi:hypothetical protein NMG60_11013051 [Bertholletia excelsa]
MPEREITALKEALCQQQELLHKLQNDLDVEREASATAASEALSMILRLQGEKAAVKMEASQYKRLAEEKMTHADEALELFEDLIYQKEMEIACLEYQVQAYRQKLFGLGCSDSECELKIPENLLSMDENVQGNTHPQRSLRRNSMPVLPPAKFLISMKGSPERGRSHSPDIRDIAKVMEEEMGNEISAHSPDTEKKPDNSTVGDMDWYWEQIKKLDERVKEITDYKGITSTDLRKEPRSSSLIRHRSVGLLLDTARETISSAKSSKDRQSEAAPTVPSCSSNVHVFEVPPSQENERGSKGQPKQKRRLKLEGIDQRVGKSDSIPLEDIKTHVNEGSNMAKTMVPPPYQKNSLSKTSDAVVESQAKLPQTSRAPEMVEAERRGSRQELGHESQPKLRQMNETSEIVEVDSQCLRQESGSEGEELKMLKAIQKQLNSIEAEIRSWKAKKPSPSYELPQHSLCEVCILLWFFSLLYVHP